MSTNDVTGDALRSKATTEKYRENFEAIFRPLCTDCGKRQDIGMIHTCSPTEPAESGSNLMEVDKDERE